MGKIEFSNEDCNKIVDMYRRGISAVKIGKEYGCSRTPIKRILHEHGIELDNVLRKIPQNEYQNVIDLYNSGKTQQEIADLYGCDKQTIYTIMKSMNIKARPNGFTREDAKNMYDLYTHGKQVQEIAELYDVDRHTVGRVLKRNGFIIDRRTYYCNDDYFDNIDDQNKAYILGLLWADGCNHANKNKVTIQLQEQDRSILERIKEVSNNERPLWKSKLNDKNSNWQNSIVLTWQSRKISQALNDYGMVPRKSLVLEFPHLLHKSLYAHFIRGYIDGDGSVYYSRNKNALRVEMIGTKMFLESIQDICADIGVKTSVYHKKGCHDVICKLYTTSNIGTLKLLNWIYKDANLKILRKYDKYQQYLHDNNINNSLAG